MTEEDARVAFTYQRRYRGKIQAVLLDWAGTTMDYGCMAPAVVFMEVYKRQNVPITIDEARAPMEAHGRLPNDEDVSRMFEEFVPLQLACLSDYSELIPGTLDAVKAMRERGIKIGSTTGYTTEMMKINLEDARRQGYVPDSTVCASDVPAGRPYPFMCLQNVINLQVSPVDACVKVDDTVPGIEEGLNAGMWTIGLAVSGNEVGLPLKEVQAMEPADRAQKRERAYTRMYQCGAHYVVDSIAAIVPCLDDIEQRIARGERP
jgi:phosphonoacetaldehyde hydrolase